MSVALDYSIAFNAARLERAGQSDLHDASDYYWVNFPIFPRRFELRLAPLSWLDVGGDAGWLDGGFDVRFGLPSRPHRFLAGNLALGARSGEPGTFKDTKATHSLWGRVEAYPLLYESFDAWGLSATHRGMLALGINSGVFYHQVAEPEDPREPMEGPGFSAVQILRQELRLEAAIGYWFKPRRIPALLAGVEPYWVLAGEHPQDAYHQKWGVVLVLRGALVFPFEPAAAAPARP